MDGSLHFHRSNRKVWRMIFGTSIFRQGKRRAAKVFLMVWMLQIFVSAICVSSASAEPNISVSLTAQHCLSSTMVMSEKAAMSHAPVSHLPCNHCDAPDLGLSASLPASADQNQVDVLLAILEFPISNAQRLSLKHVDWLEPGAPPHSFSLLYHTTRRILI